MNEISLSDIAALMGNNKDGGLGGDYGAWWLLILIVLFGGFSRGWGNDGNGGAGDVGGNQLYPWINQAETVNTGFRDQMMTTGIDAIQQALCTGFGQVQTGMLQGFNAIQAQQAQCCCDNQLAMANQTATILAEHCADRAALSDGIRDVIAAQTAGTQRIIDQMCQDKIDAKNDEIAQLRQQIVTMNLAASQNAQTQALIADNFAQTNALEQYLAPVPRPAYIVQNPNCCTGFAGCGCGA